MNNKLISTAVLMTISSGVSFNASAALASNAVLLFNDGVNGCITGDTGTYPNCSTYSTITAGSYFALDSNGDSRFSDYERVGMRRQDGVIINTMQPGSSGFNAAAGTIDKPFSFLSVYGVHQTTSPVSILSDDSAGYVTLDFSGWGITWNGVPDIPLGSSATANLICGTDCSLGDTFTLHYTALIPPYHPSGFGLVYYGVHLEGTIGAVPVPAAAWLFGSGLIGLAGAMKRRKAA